jgi:hypothetical protein
VCAAVLYLAAGAYLPGRAIEPEERLRVADDAWDRGDYADALRGYLDLFDAPGADRLLPAIALRTGELFQTIALTDNGGAPQFSPDGRHLAYEVGRGPGRRTRLARVGTPTAVEAELPGHTASFAPDGRHVAYLRPPADVVTATSAPAATDVMLRRLGDGAEQRIETASLGVTAVLAGTGDTLVVAAPDAQGLEQLHLVAPGRVPTALTEGPPGKILRAVNAGGSAVLFIHTRQGASTPPAFGLVALPHGSVRTVSGSAPAFSGDGHSLVWLRRTAGATEIMAAPARSVGEGVLVRSGQEPVDRPALSPDGRRIAFQIMHDHDWELHVIDRDGGAEGRITRSLQHDVMPRFLDSGRLFGVKGEPRHHRSYLHDLETGTRTRLFHNNTVRTIAPEYQWAASPDGRKLMVVADRDGDTISPERGVYLIDLDRAVTRQALRARLVASLAAEHALHERSHAIAAHAADAIRPVVAAASQSRVEAYQEALFAFGSKHISQPGNRQAADYLFATYASFGYEPVFQWVDTPAAPGGRTANVLATLRGTRHPDVVYVVSSHYDSVWVSPGADDNSSGTATLLEAARLLASHPQPATIVFASFTGEESGLLGSREFVRRARGAGTHIAAVLNNDMIGWADDGRLDNTIRYGREGIRDVQHAAAILFTNLITYDARYFRGTDAQAFHEGYGPLVGGIGSYPILANPHYHQHTDAIATINHQLVTEVARTTVASIMLLASSPSPVRDLRMEVARGQARLTWSPSRERDVVGYLVEWQGPTGGPARRQEVTAAAATIQATAGSRVSVHAVNRAGARSWDTPTVMVP